MTEEELRASLPEHLRRCGVPRDVIQGLAEPFETRAMAAYREWRATNELALVLIGAPGCGKSYAAAMLLAENKNCFRVYLHAPGDLPPDWRWSGGFFCGVRQDLGGPKASWEHLVAIRTRATETSALVLDDAGTEKGDGEDVLFAVLADRYAAQRRTVLTSNLNEANFRARYGGRLLSRILGSGRIANVNGPDLRMARPRPEASGSSDGQAAEP